MTFLEMTGLIFWGVIGVWILFLLIELIRDLHRKYKRWIKR